MTRSFEWACLTVALLAVVVAVAAATTALNLYDRVAAEAEGRRVCVRALDKATAQVDFVKEMMVPARETRTAKLPAIDRIPTGIGGGEER